MLNGRIINAFRNIIKEHLEYADIRLKIVSRSEEEISEG